MLCGGSQRGSEVVEFAFSVSTRKQKNYSPLKSPRLTNVKSRQRNRQFMSDSLDAGGLLLTRAWNLKVWSFRWITCERLRMLGEPRAKQNSPRLCADFHAAQSGGEYLAGGDANRLRCGPRRAQDIPARHARQRRISAVAIRPQLQTHFRERHHKGGYERRQLGRVFPAS